jgi:hypothetical protein
VNAVGILSHLVTSNGTKFPCYLPADRPDLDNHARIAVVSRFVEDIRKARREGRIPARFGPDQLRRACPGWADRTYSVFLPKHRAGNPGGYNVYFTKNSDGTYSLS